MEKNDLSYLKGVKRITTKNIADDIRAWLAEHPDKDREDFAKIAGVSLRTLASILNWDGEGEEPNWTRSTMQGIIDALACEDFYTPKHDIK